MKKKSFILIFLFIFLISLATSGTLSDFNWRNKTNAYFTLDESSGNPIDSTGNFTSNAINISKYSVPGRINTALKFNATATNNGSIVYSLSNLSIGSYPFSFNAWINTSYAQKTIGTIVSFGNSGNSNTKYNLQVQGGDVEIFLRDYGEASSTVDSNLDAENGKWIMVTAVFINNTNRRLYVNGTYAESTVSPVSLSPINQVGIGADVGSGKVPSSGIAWPFIGLIDEVAVWGRALSDAEVSELYANGGGKFYSPYIENSQNHSGLVFETETTDFSLNMTYDSALWDSIAGNLIYNGTSYTGTQAGSGNTISFSRTIDLPTLNATTNRTFYWRIDLTNSTGTYYYNSSIKNQTVENLVFVNCNSTFSTQYINFTTKSASNPFPKINATFKTGWDFWMGTGNIQESYDFEDVTHGNRSWAFCLANNTENVSVDGHIEYDGNGYSLNSYYIDNLTLSNSTTYVNLYLLNDSLATVTVLKAQDEAQSPEADVTIQIQFYDVGTDTFYTIGMARTDFNGQDVAYLNWYDTLYKFILSRNGEVLLTTNTTRISETPFKFNIKDSAVYAFDKFADFVYSLYFNNVTNNFVLTFTKPSGDVDEGCLRVIRRTAENDTTLCETCETSSSATLYCNIAGYGNGTYLATFYATGSYFLVDTIYETIGQSFAEGIYDLLGIIDSSFYAFIFSGVVTGAFWISPVLGLIGVILGVLGGAALGFSRLNYIEFVGIAIVGGVIAWLAGR